MFKSRHTIALSIIALYFVPILFLTIFGMNAMSSQKTWEFFSYGLFFGIAGALTLFSLMIHFETTVNNDENEEESEIGFQNEFKEGLESLAALETIVTNLNEELGQKKQEIQHLSSENFNLRHRVEEIEEVVEKEPVSQFIKSEPIAEFIKSEPEKTLDNAVFQKVDDYNLARDNRIEVTKL